MVGQDIGSLRIKGTLDSAELESSLSRVKGRFSDFGAGIKSVFGDTDRLASSAKDLGKSLVTIGKVGVAAFTGLSAISPGVAPALATMKTNLFALSNVAGQQLAPIFEAIGQDLIPSITSAIVDSEGVIGSFVNTISQGVSDIASLIRGDLSEIEGLVPKGSGAAIGAAAGFAIGGPAGMFIGAALGYGAGSALTPNQENVAGNIEGLLSSFTPGDFSRQDGGVGFNPIEERGYTGIGGLFEFGSDITAQFAQFIEDIFGRASERDKTIASVGK